MKKRLKEINTNLLTVTDVTKNKLYDPEIKKIFARTKSIFESVDKNSKKVVLKTKEIISKAYNNVIPEVEVIENEEENGAASDKEKEMYLDINIK